MFVQLPGCHAHTLCSFNISSEQNRQDAAVRLQPTPLVESVLTCTSPSLQLVVCLLVYM